LWRGGWWNEMGKVEGEGEKGRLREEWWYMYNIIERIRKYFKAIPFSTCAAKTVDKQVYTYTPTLHHTHLH
jgi:hypothetical protein